VWRQDVLNGSGSWRCTVLAVQALLCSSDGAPLLCTALCVLGLMVGLGLLLVVGSV
jgi:hypothetical protein